MNTASPENPYFKFEEDFIEPSIRCIPMVVRFKLDACGIKLKLAEWSRMTLDEREKLASGACETPDQVLRYSAALVELILSRTGQRPTQIPVEHDPAWSRMDEVPLPVREKLREQRCVVSLVQWQALTALQRFALLKLSYPGHENKNFPRALEEFGLSVSGPKHPQAH